MFGTMIFNPSTSNSHDTISYTISITFILFILFANFFIKKPKIPSHSLPLPPGPTPLPYFGCIIPILQIQTTLFRWIHKLMEDMKTEIMCLRVGPSIHIIVVTSPKLACEFLMKKDAIFASRPKCISAYLTSCGYLSTALVPIGDQWKKMRRVINQVVLSSTRHKWLESKRNEEADHLLRYICNRIKNYGHAKGGGLVNVRIATQHYCGNIIRKMIFGKRFFGKGMEDGGSGEEEVEHVAALFTIIKYLYNFCVSDYFPWLRGKCDLDGQERIVRTAFESVQKYHYHLIEERIQQWKDGAIKIEEYLLDVLINLDKPTLTPEEIKAQTTELMIGTVDNPSNAIEWVIAEMINEPLILQKAVEEMDKMVGKERLVEESDLPRLNYIKACAKEAFRLHPLSPFNIPHVSIEDTTVGGYFIPRGSHILLSRRGLGRDPYVWEDPLRFDPERHLNVDEKEVVLTNHELHMLSFSTGRCGCPRSMLGSTMTTMLLARMVQGFSWEVPPDESGIELEEDLSEPCLAKPLIALAKMRLPECLYPKNF